MNILARDVMAFIDSSSECYYQVSTREIVSVTMYMGKGDLCEDLLRKDIHPYKLCLFLKRL